MRDILFLAHRIPYPPNKGDKLRAWSFLRHLAGRRRVHLGCFIDDERDWAHVPFLKTLGGDSCFVPLRRSRALVRSVPSLLTSTPLTWPYYHDPTLAAWVARLRRDRPTTVFAYSSSMAQYAMDGPRSPRIIDFVDVDSEKWRAYALRRRWPLAMVYRREGQALFEAERRVAREFDASLFVSEAEAALFRSLAPETSSRVFTVPVGVDWRHFSPALDYPDPYRGAGASAICFTGMMDYWPNVDAVGWFVEAVLPRVRRAHPAATFWIVGASPTRSVRNLARRAGVIVTGRVVDTRPYLAHAGAIVAPLRVARGIQSKVLEAMAMGRPVIASPQAFEGIRAEPGRDLIVAENAPGFAAAIDRIWEGEGSTLGRRARETVQQGYDWSRPLACLDAVVAATEAAWMEGHAGRDCKRAVC